MKLDVYLGTPLISKISTSVALTSFGVSLFMGSVTFSFSDFKKTSLNRLENPYSRKKNEEYLGKSVFRLLLEKNSINGAREKQNF